MVQAAAMSGMDFSETEPRNRHWWLKVRWILDRIEDLNTEKIFQMQHAQHACVLDYDLDKSAFDGHWNAANQLLRNMYLLHFPWTKDETTNKRRSEYDDLMALWKAKFGDPADPKVQARFKKVAEALRRKTDEASKGMFQEQQKLRKMVKHIVGSRRKGRTKGKK